MYTLKVMAPNDSSDLTLVYTEMKENGKTWAKDNIGSQHLVHIWIVDKQQGSLIVGLKSISLLPTLFSDILLS